MVEPLDLDALARERFADVEALLIDWMGQALAGLGLYYAAELPAGDDLAGLLNEHAGFVQVEAFGGSDRNPAQDVANVDVDVYKRGDVDGNPDRGGAMDAARMIRAALLFRLPGYFTPEATVSKVATFARPSARPYDDGDPTVRKVGASYQVVVKST